MLFALLPVVCSVLSMVLVSFLTALMAFLLPTRAVSKHSEVTDCDVKQYQSLFWQESCTVTGLPHKTQGEKEEKCHCADQKRKLRNKVFPQTPMRFLFGKSGSWRVVSLPYTWGQCWVILFFFFLEMIKNWLIHMSMELSDFGKTQKESYSFITGFFLRTWHYLNRGLTVILVPFFFLLIIILRLTCCWQSSKWEISL